ncbi:disintegrin and metalloproteinase domain-containing protein 9-like [Neolamprologus brichardi]|uniref:disintegrin and metalloproteinase domain-containing protein 9-like n=1 Tax=Neolamprologus brichardi TaxID=32507 RepID=UPI001643BC18|nr:disintegrin and metalloproteinase domain-containing protein 9-like [Neolamprologus brichardi]
MVRSYTLITIFLHFHVFGIDSRDVFHGLSKYSIVNPQMIHRWSKSINSPRHSKEKYGDETLSYAVTIDNKKHILSEKAHSEQTSYTQILFSICVMPPVTMTHHIQQIKCTAITMEKWKDIRIHLGGSALAGVIFFGNETFGLEPVPHSTTNEHILYLLEDVQTEPVTCGVVTEATSVPSHEPFEPGQSLTSLLRRKRSLSQTSYVELVLVVDNLRVSVFPVYYPESTNV